MIIVLKEMQWSGEKGGLEDTNSDGLNRGWGDSQSAKA